MKLEKAESKSSCIRRRQIFDAYEKGLEYKKKVALESISTENEMKELIELSMTMKYFADKEIQTPLKNLGFFEYVKIVFFSFLLFYSQPELNSK